MFFTQEDFKKIEKWLSQNAVKDTEFNEAVLPLNGNEEITIIQGNHNKKVLLKDLVNNIKLLGNFDFINVSESFNAKYISLQNAISLIPHRGRKIGQVITFLGTDGNWGIYQFKGESLEVWNNITLWINIIESLHIDSILPDEEDLTITTPDVQGNVKMKFKDKDYSPLDFSGLGKIYLRKNITTIIDTDNNIAKDINLLTQQAFSKENTIYIIQYDFDLNGETITIPEGCVLKFDGGSFTNGTINGNNTVINASPIQIFKNIGLNGAGNWKVDYSYAEWFGAIADGVTDCAGAINAALYMTNDVRLLKGTYAISYPITLSYRRKLSGHQGDDTKIIPTEGADMEALIIVSSGDGTTAYGHLRDLGVYQSPGIGIKCYGITQGFNIENIEIKYCADAGLVVSKCWYASFRNINSWANKYGLYLNDVNRNEGLTGVNGIQFDNCWFNQNKEHSIYSDGHTTALSFNGCTFENTVNGDEINFTDFYTDVTFNSCYMETNRRGFNIQPSYIVSDLNIIGGIYHFKNPTTELMNIGTIRNFNIIGTRVTIGDASGMSEVEACVISRSLSNVSLASFPSSKKTFSVTGNLMALDNYFNDYNNDYVNCLVKHWQTNSLRITHDNYGQSAAKFYLGLESDTKVPTSTGIKGFEISQNVTDTSVTDSINFSIKRRNDYTEPIFIVRNYGDVYFSRRVKGHITPYSGPTSSRPAWSSAHIGMIYFDTDLGKPVFMKASGVWVDASGNQV